MSLAIMFLLTITTPFIVKNGIAFLDEEVVELIMIAFLLVSGFSVYRKYKKYLNERQESFDDMVRHIGALNLQVDQIQGLLQATHQKPTNAKEMRRTLGLLCDTVLGVVNVEWVMIRVIDESSLRTEIEKTVGRGDKWVPKINISNKDLVGGVDKNIYYSSEYACGDTKKLFCVVPKSELSTHQEILLKTIVNNAGMIYHLYSIK